MSIEPTFIGPMLRGQSDALGALDQFFRSGKTSLNARHPTPQRTESLPDLFRIERFVAIGFTVFGQ